MVDVSACLPSQLALRCCTSIAVQPALERCTAIAVAEHLLNVPPTPHWLAGVLRAPGAGGGAHALRLLACWQALQL